MSAMNPRIEQFLVALKANGRSSPNDWHRFHLFLERKKQPGQKAPPVPLILAASDESNASKHHRLSAQLYWAQENGCIEDALRYLKDIRVEHWNSCPPDEWFQDNYPKPDGTYGPIHLEWTSDSKPKSSAESAAHAIEILRAQWDEVAGQELRGVTSPLRFEGAKGRRLVILAKREASPPWGTWTSLDQGENRRFFTRFRAAVNAAIKPLEVDHIDFVHEPTEATP